MVRYDQIDKSQVTNSHYAKFGFDLYMIYNFVYSLITEFRRKARVHKMICWCLPCLLTLDRPRGSAYSACYPERTPTIFESQELLTWFQNHHSRRPAPKKLATTTAARLPTSPVADGASPGAMLCELDELDELEDPEDVEVPLVVLWSVSTRADRLASVEKAAVTELPFLQSDV